MDYPGLTEEEIKQCEIDGLSKSQLSKRNERAIKNFNKKLSALTLYKLGPRASFRVKELRLVLLGKTGSGKSSTGNLIIGQNVFKESHQSISCTTKIKCAECQVDGIRVRLADTPGLVDTGTSTECILKEIKKVLNEFTDGVHGFLFVYSLGNPRFTSEEKLAFQQISKGQFGPRFLDHCFVIMTNGDNLICRDTLANFLESERDTDFGCLLNNTLNRRVIAIENSDLTPYGRMEQRQQIIRLVASYV